MRLLATTVLLLIAVLPTCETKGRSNVGAGCVTQNDCAVGLACMQGDCNTCVVDSDCGQYKKCTTRLGMAICVDKDVFAPFKATDALAAFLAVFSTALGCACGLGGGGLLVPLYIIVLDLSPKLAIPLSKATIFGGAVATYWTNYNAKHPYAKHRPLIDYALAGLMEPPTLLGTIFGVMANTSFPPWLILVLLILLLVVVTHRTLSKANKLYAKETNGGLLMEENGKQEPSHKINLTNEDDDEETTRSEAESCQITDPATSKLIQEEIVRIESITFPFKSYILPILVCIGIILAQGYIRGGPGTPSLVGTTCGSLEYWLLLIPPIGFLVWITIKMGDSLQRRSQLGERCGLEPAEGDVYWTSLKAQVIFPWHCFMAGIASALLGIGGGLVQGPVMLEYGVLPLVQSATASYMILFTSSATTIQYAIAGQYPGAMQYDYVVWYAFLGFLGGILGKTVVEYLIQKSGRMSLVLYFLAVNGVIQAIAMGYIGIQTVINDSQSGGYAGFSSICGH